MGSRAQHDHYIGLFWREDNFLHQALFRAENDDVRVILDALSQASKTPVINLAERRAALRNEIQAHKGAAAALTIDHEMIVSGVRLRPGEYRVLVLPREDRYVEVDLFRGKTADITHLAAQSWAETDGVEPTSSEQIQFRATYRSDAESLLRDLTVGSKTYRLTDNALGNHGVNFDALFIEATTPVLIVRLNGRTSQVDLITYKGKRAFRSQCSINTPDG